jgi:hypothetical protein
MAIIVPPLSAKAALSLAVLIPSNSQHDTNPLISIALTLPMGWLVDTTPPHPYLPLTQLPELPQQVVFHPSSITLGPATTPLLKYTDMYIDDFMVIAQ